MLSSGRSPMSAIGMAALSVVLVGFGAWVGQRTNYYPALNDFWPLLFQSNTFDWSNLDSLKNGFFPPGYGLFLWLLGGENVLARAFLANVLFGVAVVLTTYVVTRRYGSTAAALGCAILTAVHPMVFSLTLTTGPDVGCLFFATAGFSALLLGGHATSSAGRNALWWMAGVLLGLATLWRYHALVFAVAAVASAFVVFRQKGTWRAAIGLALSLLVLASLSLLPGFSEQLARAQAFNVYKTLHPINWHHMPTDLPTSIISVIRSDPAAFWQAYWQFNRPLLWVLIPPALAALFLRSSGRQVGIASLLLIAIYVPIVGVGASERGLALVLPTAIVCSALLIDRIGGKIPVLAPRRLGTPVVMLIALLVVSRMWWVSNRTFVEGSIGGFEWRRVIETELRSVGVRTPLELFTDSPFHFVTEHGPGWYSYYPRVNGGWPRLDLYRFDELVPAFSTANLDQFIADCERRGVTHLVLTPGAGLLFPDLGRVATDRLQHPRLHPITTVAGVRIVRVG